MRLIFILLYPITNSLLYFLYLNSPISIKKLSNIKNPILAVETIFLNSILSLILYYIFPKISFFFTPLVIFTIYLKHQHKNQKNIIEILCISIIINTLTLLTYLISESISNLSLIVINKTYLLQTNYNNTIVFITYIVSNAYIIATGIIDYKIIYKISNYKFARYTITTLWMFILFYNFLITEHKLSHLIRFTLTISLLIIFSVLKRISNIPNNKYLTNKKHKYNFPKNLAQANNFQEVETLYKNECNAFSNYLLDLGMNTKYKGYKQIILLVLLCMYCYNENYDIKNDIYPEIVKLTGSNSVKSVEGNIANAIKRTWSTVDPETLSKNYTGIIAKGSGNPSIKELASYMIQKFSYLKQK